MTDEHDDVRDELPEQDPPESGESVTPEPSPPAEIDESDGIDPGEEIAAPPEEPVDLEIDARVRRLSRRGFLTMAVAAGAGYAGWKWLQTRPPIDRRPWPLRRVLEWNERLAMGYYDSDRLSPTFPPSRITPLRANGRHGLDPNGSTDDWKLTLHGVAGASAAVEVPLREIMRLPGHEMITELRCIEGWTIVVRWTGTRLVELMRRYPPASRDGSPPDLMRRPERLVRYASMETPGRGYYVGLDMPSVLHPQTMLVWEMNGEPIDWRHGAPLRLAIPVKYGIKNIKRVSTIRYTDDRPRDFWADRGYDWYAGF